VRSRAAMAVLPRMPTPRTIQGCSSDQHARHRSGLHHNHHTRATPSAETLLNQISGFGLTLIGLLIVDKSVDGRTSQTSPVADDA
jgi:hypothetical protein